MRLREFASDSADQVDQVDQELVALTSLLKQQSENAGADLKISLTAFMNLARNLGINNLSKEQLIDFATEEPLNNVIKTIKGDEVYFKGADDEVTDTETPKPDENAKIVDKMAQSQVKRGLPGPLGS